MAKRHKSDGIELGRTFLQVPESAAQLDPDDLVRLALVLNRGATWSQVLEHQYVVVLGEAGTGKSTEFQRQAKELSRAGSLGVFVELNDLAANGLTESIEPEDEARVSEWRSTTEPGVFFLDSLDEAKLQKHTLRQGLRRLRRALKDEWARVRLVISCRVSDWRPDADRADVEKVIPEESEASVHIVQLAPLADNQIEALAAHAGVIDVAAFMTAISDNHAHVFVERPLDVQWLGSYWTRHGRIGSLRELVEDNIREKLKERPGRASTLAPAKAALGVRALAGIATLSRRQSFLVADDSPDALRAAMAIDARDVLPNWSDDEMQQLLRRPIFDESTYGRVRIHHRSVQEYLAAHWLKDLCEAGMGRPALDALMFREGASGRAIPQHLAPVAAFLCSWDDVLRAQLIEEAPTLLIGHGDPSGFSDAERCALLRAYASAYGDRRRRFDSFDHASLNRFSSPALAKPIVALLSDRSGSEEFAGLLLQLVEHGRIAACVPMALELSLDTSLSSDVRFYAIRAVGVVGTPVQRGQMVGLLETTETWEHDVAGAFVRALYPEMLDADSLVSLLSRTERKRRNLTTSLQVVLEHELPGLGDVGQRLVLLRAMVDFVWVDEGGGKRAVQSDRMWLLDMVGKVAAGILDELPPDLEQPPQVADALELFRWCNEKRVPAWHGLDEVRRAVAQHAEVRRGLFWRRVAGHVQRHGVTPTRVFELRYSYEIFELGTADVPWLVQDATTREEVREQLLAFDALTLVPWVVDEQEERMDVLRSVAATCPALRKRLERMTRGHASIHPQTLRWQREQRAREMAETRRASEQRAALSEHLDAIRAGTHFHGLWFLLHEADRSGDLRGGVSHDSLRPRFGDEIAEAARDGWRAFWRTFDPPLPHEREERNRTPYGVILGLSGLNSEVAGGLDVSGLDERLTRIATRYAVCELNRFPEWLAELALRHPDVVASELGPAVAADYEHPDQGELVLDVLAKLPRAERHIRLALAPVIARLVATRDAPIVAALIDALSVLLTTEGADVTVFDAVVKDRCQAAVGEPRRFSVWWCCWLNECASKALDFLEKTLGELPKEDGYQLVEQICHQLHQCADGLVLLPMPVVKESAALARFIPIVYEQITPETDIHREDVFNPGPRDHAQEIRSRLITWMNDIPGDETVAAIHRVAEDPRMAATREWLLHNAEQRLVANAGASEPDVTEALVALYRRHGTEAPNELGDLREDVNVLRVQVLPAKPLESEMSKDCLLQIAEMSAGGFGKVQPDELRSRTAMSKTQFKDELERLEVDGLIRQKRAAGAIMSLELSATGREMARSMGASISSPRADARELRRVLREHGQGDKKGRESVSLGTLVGIVEWELARVHESAQILVEQGFVEFVRSPINLQQRQIGLTAKGRQ